MTPGFRISKTNNISSEFPMFFPIVSDDRLWRKAEAAWLKSAGDAYQLSPVDASNNRLHR
ncbi:hypothetical protein FHX09_002089 [Rhizobium sp. BK538]|nr:hypothetical protein [Rhizobium sp. BK538]